MLKMFRNIRIGYRNLARIIPHYLSSKMWVDSIFPLFDSSRQRSLLRILLRVHQKQVLHTEKSERLNYHCPIHESLFSWKSKLSYHTLLDQIFITHPAHMQVMENLLPFTKVLRRFKIINQVVMFLIRKVLT